jgi:oxaloacetate decarboxylase (Na+ extruding) subunit alpha
VLEESSRVRMELGYPVMVTPFSQFVGVQATMNIIQGERYKTIPSELVAYVLGRYGSPAAPIDANVKDRVLQGKSLEPVDLQAQFARPMLKEFAKSKGPFRSGEDLLLHLFYGKDHVAAMYASGVALDARPSIDTPLAELVKGLLASPGLSSARIENGELKLALSLA